MRWPVKDLPSRKYKPGIDPFSNEKAAEDWIAQAARVFGWRRYHTHRSKNSPSGYPDDMLIRGPRLIYAEVKTCWNPNPTDAQKAWLNDLAAWRDVFDLYRGFGDAAITPHIGAALSFEVYLWRFGRPDNPDYVSVDDVLAVLR